MTSIHAATGDGQAIPREQARPARQAYQILHFAFVAAPILAGADKFLHLLCNWDQYLAAWIARLSPIGGHNLLLAAGIVEIAAAFLWPSGRKSVPRSVEAWLCLIILNLLTMGAFFDVALRDLGLALGAFALGRLAIEFDPEIRRKSN